MKTDKQIQQDVIEELSWEPSVNATHIGVEVSGGVVTLAGHVGSYAEKIGAAAAAQRVSGVKSIAVEMHVNLPDANKRTDADIARSTQNVLEWTTYLLPDSIKAKVENGWVTLSGQVEWEYQRSAAVSAVSLLMGVKGVTDLIVLQPVVSSALVKTEIEAALRRRARDDARGISVEVRGSDVTLTGVVASWSERELAKDSALGTPGVHKVVDNMTITY